MTKRELIDLCLTFPDCYEDYPFDGEPENSKRGDAWAAMRHHSNKKTFAFIRIQGGELVANLKCEPMKADFLRSVYRGVIPGYHMNKVHWNTVSANSDVPYEELVMMITDSYRLTGGKGI